MAWLAGSKRPSLPGAPPLLSREANKISASLASRVWEGQFAALEKGFARTKVLAAAAQSPPSLIHVMGVLGM